MMAQEEGNNEEEIISPHSLSKAVAKLASDLEFKEKHKSKNAPLAVLAFATEVTERTIRPI